MRRQRLQDGQGLSHRRGRSLSVCLSVCLSLMEVVDRCLSVMSVCLSSKRSVDARGKWQKSRFRPISVTPSLSLGFFFPTVFQLKRSSLTPAFAFAFLLFFSIYFSLPSALLSSFAISPSFPFALLFHLPFFAICSSLPSLRHHLPPNPYSSDIGKIEQHARYIRRYIRLPSRSS